MQQRSLKLISVFGTVVLLYVVGRVEGLARHQLQIGVLPTGLYLVSSLLYGAIGLLLSSPDWWLRRRHLAPDWGTLCVYALPGVILVAIVFVRDMMLTVFRGEIGPVVWLATVTMGHLVGGGARIMGGVLIGFGLGKGLFTDRA